MNALALILLNGICWGSFGLIARASELGAIWVNAGIVIGTLVFPLAHTVVSRSPFPALLPFMICVVAGVVNGIGMIPYGQLIDGSIRGRWELSSVLPASLIVVATVAMLGACYWYGESFTARKALGLVLAGTAIYLIR